ncbi:hypothetical protein CQW23_24239 [Capsicum baccatum]|uniref:Uncharacterized protein n=1 Tax=Capsicum baccatum TaxID=33114 RepID=A0A2G2VU69_CAPBA|nr:hypothetical protein CQW23_24239 [Capsicum baccatum]
MSSTNPEQIDEINIGVRYMGLSSEQNDGWKVYGQGSRYNWYAANNPQKLAMTQLHADDNKVGEHDTSDNELDFIDESDDDLQYDDFDSNVTETSYEFFKKDKRSC